jgi:NAD(P)H-binding
MHHAVDSERTEWISSGGPVIRSPSPKLGRGSTIVFEGGRKRLITILLVFGRLLAGLLAACFTGANRGLGRHLASELLNRGATVFAGARNPDAVDLAGVKPVALDITDLHSVRAAAEAGRGYHTADQQRGIRHRLGSPQR